MPLTRKCWCCRPARFWSRILNGTGISSSNSLGVIDPDWKIAGVGDLNGDGEADIVWRHTDGTLAIWLMNGAGISGSAVLGVVDPNWRIAGVGDFNGDGKADILWRNTDGTVFEWLMNGLAVSSYSPVAVISTDWQIAGTGDFNGDGKSDILWRNNAGGAYIWLMNGAGHQQRRVARRRRHELADCRDRGFQRRRQIRYPVAPHQRPSL